MDFPLGMSTRVLELASLPHALFDFADLLLINEKEARCLAEACNLGSKREVVDVLQRVVEPLSLVSTILETPEVILCVPWVLSLIVIRDGIQGSTILAPVSWDNTYNVGVGPHDNPSVTHRDTPPGVVSDNAGNIVSPTIEIKT